jgi:ribonuclease E
MLIDATHPEETRVAVVDGTRLEEFDFEMAARRQIKSNIYLAKVTRVEPSLQAAFVEYGGNRHAFLPFPEIHPDYYRIPIGDRPVRDEPVYEEERRERRPRRSERAEGSQDDETSGEASHDEGETPVIETAVEAESSVAPDPVVVDTTDAPEGDDAQFSDAQFSDAQSSDVQFSDDQPAVAVIDTVGGDEVEDAQRRRRSQMPHYKIQEVIKRRQIMLIQVSKEERGNKGAAVTTFLSLPGRYCVLMPNTSRGGGVSRKIANPTDRKRMKELISDLEVPDGMSVILRTAGVERSKAEIKRDLEYLLRLWENIRTLTLESSAPALIYEEGNLVKRAIRDLYSKDIDQIEIAGEEGYRQAKDFMRMLMPSHAKRVQPYRDPSIPLFFRYQVETQIDLMHNPVAHLRSGGYIVINQTEALVSIDVNSGRSTRERNIEETALKTNLEAADEIARQLRLRDMGGLVVVDFIDMDEPRHDAQVERRIKEAMKNDRARIQIGRISPFGLLELSRQRLHPSLIETNFHTCAHCQGTGLVRSIESAALLILRAIEEEGIKHRSAELAVTVAGNIALYVLNQKRGMLTEIEQRYGFSVRIFADDSLIAPEYRLERVKMKPPGSDLPPPPLNLTEVMAADDDDIEDEVEESAEAESSAAPSRVEDGEGGEPRRKRRRSRRRRGGRLDESRRDDAQGNEAQGNELPGNEVQSDADQAESFTPETVGEHADAGEGEGEEGSASEFGAAPEGETPAEGAARRRRRGRRGGRSRPRRNEDGGFDAAPQSEGDSVLIADAAEPDSGEAVEFAYHAPVADDVVHMEPVAEAVPAVETPVAEAEAEVVPLKRARAPRRKKVAAEEAPAVQAETETQPEAMPAPVEPEAVESAPVEPAPVEPIAAEPAAATVAPVAKPYENVNQPPQEPRRGWWKLR